MEYGLAFKIHELLLNSCLRFCLEKHIKREGGGKKKKKDRKKERKIERKTERERERK